MNLCSFQNIMMASNYNPTMQGSGNWCITQISWKVNDSNSAFICEMLSVQSLVLNGEEIWLSKGQWHLSKDKKKNKRMKLFGKCFNCAVALAFFSVQCAGVAGTSQPLGPVMDSSSCSTLGVILEMLMHLLLGFTIACLGDWAQRLLGVPFSCIFLV